MKTYVVGAQGNHFNERFFELTKQVLTFRECENIPTLTLKRKKINTKKNVVGAREGRLS